MKFPKPQTVKDPAYKAWITTLCCCVTGGQDYDPDTGKRSVDPHHVCLRGHGTKAGKTDDTRCIPLRHEKHVEAHNCGRDTFAARYGLDYETLITQLNEHYRRLHGQ